MPELEFRVTGIEPAVQGLQPMLQFRLEISSRAEHEAIQGIIIQAQVQIQAPGREYSPLEKDKLVEIFGTADRWGQTLRNRLWTQTQATVGAFRGLTTAHLAVPCTYDLNVLATKYFEALEDGEVPLLFLFSGSVFYTGPDNRLQVQRISWDKECIYAIPVALWKEVMEHHFPGSAWLYVQRDSFQRLCAYKRDQGLPTWEAVVESLLKGAAGRGQMRTANSEHRAADKQEETPLNQQKEEVPA